MPSALGDFYYIIENFSVVCEIFGSMALRLCVFVYKTDGNDEISWGCHGEVVGFHGKGDFLFVGAIDGNRLL